MTKNQILEMFAIGPEVRDSRLCDPISAAIGIGGNLISGIISGGAANSAGKRLEQAGKDAAARTDRTTQQVNEDLIGAGHTTAEQLRQAAGEGITRNDAAVSGANTKLEDSTTQANLLLDPYRQSGEDANSTLRTGLVAGGDFNKTPVLADLQMDPGYAFRAEQATKALQGTAAARGGAQGGGATRDILALNSGLASQEYQNAFERFRQSTGDRFSRLNTVAGRGADVANTEGKNLIFSGNQQGQNLIGGGQFDANLNYRSASDAGAYNYGATQEAGHNSLQGTREVNDWLTGGASARSAGQVAQGNAIGGGIASGANSAVSSIGLHNLLKNPYGGGINPAYARNPLGGGNYGAGPKVF